MLAPIIEIPQFIIMVPLIVEGI